MSSAPSATVTEFAAEDLPRANRDLLAGLVTPHTYISTLKERCPHLDPVAYRLLPPGSALETLQAMTMIATSLERLGQGMGLPTGSMMALVPELEPAIIAAAAAAAHPPHASATTYWLANAEQRYCFVDNRPGAPERVFGDTVRMTNEVASQVANQLRELLDDGLPAAGAFELHDAAEELVALRERYRELMVGSDMSLWRLTPVGFNSMRNWLVFLMVDGVKRTPANAANLQSVSSLDALFGTVRSCLYRDILAERLPLLPFADADQLADDLARLDAGETVLDTLAVRLGLEPRADSYDPNTIVLSGDAEVALAKAVLAFGTAWREWAGTHRRQIVDYLERYDQYVARYIPGYTIPYAVVPAQASVGEKPHDVPERIRRERHDHPLLVALREALKPRHAVPEGVS